MWAASGKSQDDISVCHSARHEYVYCGSGARLSSASALSGPQRCIHKNMKHIRQLAALRTVVSSQQEQSCFAGSQVLQKSAINSTETSSEEIRVLSGWEAGAVPHPYNTQLLDDLFALQK